MDESTIEVDPETGWLTMEGTAALVGVMHYDDGAGGVRTEYVPPETLADVESLLAAPLTVQHPPKSLDISTTKKYQVGTVLSARFDGTRLRVRIRVTDAEAIAAIQSGTRELSPGYLAEFDRTPGHWSGKKYDAIQTKRRYNHLALVDRARGGRQARLDSWRADGALVQRTDAQMETVTIDGVEYQVPPEVAAIVNSWQASQQPAEDAQPEVDSAGAPSPAPAAAPAAGKTPSSITVKMDEDSIVAKLETRLIAAMRQDRDLERKNAAVLGETIALVRPLLPQSYRVDGKGAGQLIADAIVAKQPDLAGWVNRYRTDIARLQGRLDAILDGVKSAEEPAGEPAVDGKREDAAPPSKDPITAAKERQRVKLLAGGKA